MASDRPLAWRGAGSVLATEGLLAASGAACVLAWQMHWWATLFGASLCLCGIAGSHGWQALHRRAGATDATAGRTDAEPAPLRPLLDQVPLPLVRVDATGAHAINRAARIVFDTDDRILPAVPALLERGADRLSHEGRHWRIDAVEIGAGERQLVLIDVEAEAQAADMRAGNEMIDILGHELLNGLSPVVSLADSAVTAAARGDAMLPDILATLARRVEGLEGFTRAYRLLSRLPDPLPAPVALGDLAQDLRRLFASRFGTSVALALDLPADASAHVDRDQLTQAIWALLQNGAEAALAASGPPRITLAFAIGTQRLTVSVADSGAGIAPADRSRIFRPFFTTKPSGSGIGLSLAQRIARAHGGDLRLLPVATTTFELRTCAGGGGAKPCDLAKTAGFA
ncbi:sensor histidine kinase [Sphingomonas sp. CLY1604]|uniref:sensor histidine kinase n=1 Tax=Sphingomonas sp. CLY1604 TaxID=3457786 RepID=UPI003FD74A5C